MAMESLAAGDERPMVTVAPTVTVTIAQWGKVEFTERCVRALLDSSYRGEIEVLVYDNASPGGPGEVEHLEGVELIRGEENIGFGPAHNFMAKRGRGDLLLVLNNDTVVTPSAIATMVGAIDSDPTVGAVSPRYLGFDGMTLEMGGFVGRDGWGWQLFRGVEPPQYMARNRFEADYGSAACLLTRRDLFLDSGGFDDVYAPAYYEDTDYCFRLAARGHQVIVEPRAIVYHFEGATAGKDVSSGMKQLQEAHRSVFADRWLGALSDRRPISSDTAMIRALGLDRHSVLWVTPEIPRPDHEAGHARMVSMLRALRDRGSAAVLWAEVASEWERYGDLLSEEGIPWFGFRLSARLTGENRSQYSTIQALLGIDSWDVVIVSFPQMAKRVIPAVREVAPEVPVLVDAVDLHFLREQRARGAIIGGDDVAMDEELEIYRLADGVITAGKHEVELLTDLVPETPASAFSSVATLELRNEPLSSAQGEPVFLGNVNHEPNLAAVDYWAQEVFPRLGPSARRPLVLYGSGTERVRHRWPPEKVQVRGWARDLAVVFEKARCFVAPLTYGAGTKGKILEAAAAGVPVVTTSIGAEGFDGALLASMTVADDANEFAKAVESIISDDEVWNGAREAVLAGARDWRNRSIVEQDEWVSWVRRRETLTPPKRRSEQPDS